MRSAGVLPTRKHRPDTLDVEMCRALATWIRRARAHRPMVVAEAAAAAAAAAIIGALEARLLHVYLLKRRLISAQKLLGTALDAGAAPTLRRG